MAARVDRLAALAAHLGSPVPATRAVGRAGAGSRDRSGHHVDLRRSNVVTPAADFYARKPRLSPRRLSPPRHFHLGLAALARWRNAGAFSLDRFRSRRGSDPNGIPPATRSK